MGFFKPGKEFYKKIDLQSPAVNIIRLLCAYLLHLKTVTEVAQGKEMMSYAKKHPTIFSNQAWFYPMLVGAMKICGGFFATLTNAIVIMQSDDETEAVKDFIAV